MAETLLTRDDNGKAIAIPVGTRVAVRLDESPTTGYLWANKTLGDLLILEASDYSPPAPDVVGGGGIRTLRFLASKPGAATLLLKLLREWEGESSAAEVVSVEIRATQP